MEPLISDNVLLNSITKTQDKFSFALTLFRMGFSGAHGSGTVTHILQ